MVLNRKQDAIGRKKEGSQEFYLKSGTGKDCPIHKMENVLFILTSTSWRRPPEILGATEPTGSLKETEQTNMLKDESKGTKESNLNLK